MINTVVPFNNSSKLTLKKLDKKLLMEIFTLTIETPLSCPKLVKLTISQRNKVLSEKFSFPQKNRKRQNPF